MPGMGCPGGGACGPKPIGARPRGRTGRLDAPFRRPPPRRSRQYPDIGRDRPPPDRRPPPVPSRRPVGRTLGLCTRPPPAIGTGPDATSRIRIRRPSNRSDVLRRRPMPPTWTPPPPGGGAPPAIGTAAARNGKVAVSTMKPATRFTARASRAEDRRAPTSAGRRTPAPPRPIDPPAAPAAAPMPKEGAGLVDTAHSAASWRAGPGRCVEPGQPLGQMLGHDRGQHGRDLADTHGAQGVRIRHDLRGGAPAHDAALLDHHHPVGQELRLVHVMGDQNHRHGEMRAQRDDLGIELLARCPVHRREGFVEQKRPWAASQRAGQCDALLLAARQLRGPAVGEAMQVHQVEDAAGFIAVRLIHRRHDVLRG